MSSLKLSINRFSQAMQSVIRNAVKAGTIRKADKLDTQDLLASLAESGTKSGQALNGCGATFPTVMTSCDYCRTKYGRDVQVDEDDINTMFSSDGRKALLLAETIAKLRNKPEVTEEELLEVLTGAGGLNEPVSKKILDRLGIKIKDINQAFNVLNN